MMWIQKYTKCKIKDDHFDKRVVVMQPKVGQVEKYDERFLHY